LRDLELFGTNALLEACFTPILRAQIYAASGIEARERLTAAEQCLLDRMRERRAIAETPPPGR
jgi:hypothetical protein